MPQGWDLVEKWEWGGGAGGVGLVGSRGLERKKKHNQIKC